MVRILNERNERITPVTSRQQSVFGEAKPTIKVEYNWAFGGTKFADPLHEIVS